MNAFISVNPFTEQQLASFPILTEEQMEMVLSHADAAQKQWRNTSHQYRSELFLTLASLIKQNVDHLAALATTDMGKTFAE